MLDSFARLGLAFMTLWPPNQAPGALTDAGALARGSQRPTNAFEAFRRSWEEVRPAGPSCADIHSGSDEAAAILREGGGIRHGACHSGLRVGVWVSGHRVSPLSGCLALGARWARFVQQ